MARKPVDPNKNHLYYGDNLHVLRESIATESVHCDPTASHYLKISMDAILGPEMFRNEIIWKRTSAHSSAKKFGPIHDVILYYGASKKCTWTFGGQSPPRRCPSQRTELMS